MTTYSVNGIAPYFASMKDARAYATSHDPTDEKIGEFTVLAHILNDKKKDLGMVAIDESGDFGYLDLQECCGFPMDPDGTIHNKGFRCTLMGNAGRFHLRFLEEVVPFNDIESACKGFIMISVERGYQPWQIVILEDEKHAAVGSLFLDDDLKPLCDYKGIVHKVSKNGNLGEEKHNMIVDYGKMVIYKNVNETEKRLYFLSKELDLNKQFCNYLENKEKKGVI